MKRQRKQHHTTSTKLAGNEPSRASSLPFHLARAESARSNPDSQRAARSTKQRTHHVSVESLFSVIVMTWPLEKDRSPGSTARKSYSAIARPTPSPCPSGLLSARSRSASRYRAAAASTARVPGPNGLSSSSSVGPNGEAKSVSKRVSNRGGSSIGGA